MVVLAFIGFLAVIFLFGFAFRHFDESLENDKPVHKSFAFVMPIPLSAFLLLVYYFASKGNLMYVISKIYCILCALFLAVSVIENIYRTIRKKTIPKSDSFHSYYTGRYFYLIPIITISLLFVYIFTSPFFHQLVNYHRLEREPQGAKYAYYVIAENEKGKEYTLPAEVIISYDKSQEINYNPAIFDYEENTESSDLFLVRRVYFDNGGYLYFEDPLAFSKPDEKLSEIDQDGRLWKITLTDRYTTNEYIEEYFPLETKDFIFFIGIIVLVIIQTVLSYISYIEKVNKK